MKAHCAWKNGQQCKLVIDTDVQVHNGSAKRGHIVAAKSLTWSCFSNVDSFCHAHNIFGGHKSCVLDTTKNVPENLQKHLLCPSGAQQCCRVLPRKATSQDTMLPPQCVLVLPGPKFKRCYLAMFGLADVLSTRPRIIHLWDMVRVINVKYPL